MTKLGLLAVMYSLRELLNEDRKDSAKRVIEAIIAEATGKAEVER